MIQLSAHADDTLTAAQTHEQRGNIAAAEKAYLDALNVNPSRTDIIFLLGKFYQRTGLYTKAVRTLEKLLPITPDDAHLHYQLASGFYRLNILDKATKHYEETLRIMPGHSPAHMELVNLGLNLRWMKQRGKSPASERIFTQPPPELFRLQIEVTTWCNLLCAGCPRTIEIEGNRWENTHMPLAQFKAVVDTMPPSHTLCLQGVGESTLHPEFPEMVAYAKASGKYAFLTLNTNLLARPMEYYRQLKARGLDHISVSVDSFTPDIATACRKGTVTEKLFERLKELVAIYVPAVLTVSIVASKRNLHDIPSTLARLNSIGRVDVGIQGLIIYDADKGVAGNDPFALTDADIITLRNYIAAPYPNLRIEFAQGNNEAHGSRCTRPFLSPYVTAQGYLTPCCTIEDPAVLGHTKIGEKPFSELWQQPQIQRWLRAYAQTAPTICHGCCFYNG